MPDLILNIAKGYRRLWYWANANPQAFFLSLGLGAIGFWGRWLVWGAALICCVGGFRAMMKRANRGQSNAQS